MPDQAPAPARRRIALIAHDNKKQDMLEWAEVAHVALKPAVLNWRGVSQRLVRLLRRTRLVANRLDRPAAATGRRSRRTCRRPSPAPGSS